MKKIFTIFLSVMLVVACAIPTFAAEVKPYPNYIPDDEYFIVADGSRNYYLYAFNGDRYNVTYAAVSRSGVGKIHNFYFTGKSGNENYPTIIRYHLVNGEWAERMEINANGSADADSYISRVYDIQFLEGNVEIKDNSSGAVLFPLTPPLAEVVAEEMQNFRVTLVGVMKTLTLCGVGLIASLVGLKLFGRVLPIFRV